MIKDCKDYSRLILGLILVIDQVEIKDCKDYSRMILVIDQVENKDCSIGSDRRSDPIYNQSSIDCSKDGSKDYHKNNYQDGSCC